MLKVGLVGIGFMGRGHFDVYKQLESEGFPVKLVAICDVDEKKFHGEFIKGNIDVGAGRYDFSAYHKYEKLEDMIDNEELDYIDMALPTYLHSWGAVMALDAGINVLSEKPMALNTKQCADMIAARDKSGKKLMIAQCLRFWPAYVELKKKVESGEWGKVVCGSFFRGGSTPKWSFENWLLDNNRAGGALLDQHIHDVDTINWLFGTPKSVSTAGRVVFEGSGYDVVSTNYYYADNKVINAQDDWTINGKFGFEMIFRVNFEKGCLILRADGKLMAYPNDGDAIEVETATGNGYYHEVKYFADAVANDGCLCNCAPESTMETIRIAEAEVQSANLGGAIVTL